MTPETLADMSVNDRITAVCKMGDEELAKMATWYSTQLPKPWTSIVCSLAGRLVSSKAKEPIWSVPNKGDYKFARRSDQ